MYVKGTRVLWVWLAIMFASASVANAEPDGADGGNGTEASSNVDLRDVDSGEFRQRVESLYLQKGPPKSSLGQPSGAVSTGNGRPAAVPTFGQIQNAKDAEIKASVEQLFAEKLQPSADKKQLVSSPEPIGNPHASEPVVINAQPQNPAQPGGTVQEVVIPADTSEKPSVANAFPSPAYVSPNNLPPVAVSPVKEEKVLTLPSQVAQVLPSSTLSQPAPFPTTQPPLENNSQKAVSPNLAAEAVLPSQQKTLPQSLTATQLNSASEATPSSQQSLPPQSFVDSPIVAQGTANTGVTAEFSGEMAGSFLRQIAGGANIPLSSPDSSTPADIQEPIHLNEAVAFALKNNFESLAASEKSTGAKWDKWGAYAQYLPNFQISGDTGPERSQPASINDADGNRVLDNTHNRRDHTISVNQPIIDLGIVSDILAGTDREGLANNDEQDVREGVAYDTISAYLDLLQGRIAIRLADQYRGYLEQLKERMKARVAGGGGTNADLDRIRGRETIAEAARIEIMGGYQASLSEFKRLTKTIPAQIIIPVVLVPRVPVDKEQAMEDGLKHNPSYLSSLNKIDLASDDRNKAFSGLIPKLSGQYTNSYSFNAGGAAEGNPVDGVYPVQKTQSVMLVAQWSLGGTSVTGGVSGMSKIREMTLRSLDVRARLEQSITTAYATINAARERGGVLEKSVEADERVVKDFERQYTNGSRSLFDMLDAYEQLYNARLALMRVVIAEAKASYQVQKQMGELRQSILASEVP